MKNIVVRILSALIMAPMVIVAVWWGGLTFRLMMALFIVIAALEWIGMCRHTDAFKSRLIKAPAMFAGLAYILAGCMALVWLRETRADGRMLVLLVFLTVWAADTAAYFSGTLIGGPKLAPRISPKKTWSGFGGGLIAAGLVGTAMAVWGGAPENRQLITGLSVILGFTSAFGDLLESFVKRRYGVKDSGSLIPGHGGILDRIDGLLAAAIVAAIVSTTLHGHSTLWP